MRYAGSHAWGNNLTDLSGEVPARPHGVCAEALSFATRVAAGAGVLMLCGLGIQQSSDDIAARQARQIESCWQDLTAAGYSGGEVVYAIPLGECRYSITVGAFPSFDDGSLEVPTYGRLLALRESEQVIRANQNRHILQAGRAGGVLGAIWGAAAVYRRNHVPRARHKPPDDDPDWIGVG